MEGDHEKTVYTLDENSWKHLKSCLRANFSHRSPLLTGPQSPSTAGRRRHGGSQAGGQKREKYLLWMGLKYTGSKKPNF